MPDEKDQEFVEFIVKALVDHPEDVKTERTVDEMGVLITLNLHPDDMGQVIGRQGQTAKAIRTLLRVVGAKHKSRVNLKINEPEGSTRGRRIASSTATWVVEWACSSQCMRQLQQQLLFRTTTHSQTQTTSSYKVEDRLKNYHREVVVFC